MGNKEAKFKGPGKVLGTGEVVVPPKRSSLMSKLNPTTATTASSASTSIKAAMPAKKGPAKILTEVEKEERRNATLAAAQAREKAWEDRIARQRVKREKEEEAAPSERRAWNEVSPPPSMPPLDPEAARKQREAAAALEKSGFNPFQATVSSASNARSVITSMGIDEGSASSKTTGNDSASVETLQRARARLKVAMAGSDVAALGSAIAEAEKYGVPETDEAREILLVLTSETDIGEDQQIFDDVYLENILAALNAFHKTSDTPERKSAAASVLQTLLRNLLDHPEDPRYRKIRLENKTIKEKIMESANGKCIDILSAVGFERITDEEGQQCLVVPHPDSLPAETVALARKCCETALTQLQAMTF
jgi:hypothetical protein